MNKKVAFGLVVLFLIIGIGIFGITRTPKIGPANGFSETTTINLRLNERYKASGASANFFVYSGWTGNQASSYQITVVVKYVTEYAAGLTSYPIYVNKGVTFFFGGKVFEVKQVTQEMITLEMS